MSLHRYYIIITSSLLLHLITTSSLHLYISTILLYHYIITTSLHHYVITISSLHHYIITTSLQHHHITPLSLHHHYYSTISSLPHSITLSLHHSITTPEGVHNTTNTNLELSVSVLMRFQMSKQSLLRHNGRLRRPPSLAPSLLPFFSPTQSTDTMAHEYHIRHRQKFKHTQSLLHKNICVSTQQPRTQVLSNWFVTVIYF